MNTTPQQPKHHGPEVASRRRGVFTSDLIWGRPVFHPPALPNPRIMLEDFPSLVRSITRCPPPAASR